MTSRTLVARSLTPDGEALTLTLEQGDHVVRVRGEVLMSSRVSGSEEALARLALAERDLGPQPRVLVGGLGMGFTLRAVLDELDDGARVEVVELLEDVVRWNEGPLADYARRPLADPRVTVIVADLLTHITRATAGYDALILDVDNGPEAFTVAANQRLYTPTGLALLFAALRPGGVMVLWSAFRAPRFERLLHGAGFSASTTTVRARGAVRKGAKHTLFKAVRPASR
ncbi:MAG: spermidine synthase [Gammaproteobacteria bacterium]